MANSAEVVSLLVVLEFVVMSLLVLLLAPLEATASLIPLLLVFLIALYLYRA
jgi:hypothetical protein